MHELPLRVIYWCAGLIAAMTPALLLVLSLRRKTRTAEPCCAKCRYIVRGLPSETCPECGSDLRGTGTMRGAERGPIARGPRLVLWSVLVLVVWWLFTGRLGWISMKLFWPVVPKRTTQFIYLNIGENKESAGLNREWMRNVVQVVIVCDGFAPAPPPKEVLVLPYTLYDGNSGVPPGGWGLHISLAERSCYEENSWQQRVGPQAPLTTARLREFLQSNHLPLNDAQVQAIRGIVTGSTSNLAAWGMTTLPPAISPGSPITVWSNSSGRIDEALVSIGEIVNLSLLSVWLAGGLVVWWLGAPRSMRAAAK